MYGFWGRPPQLINCLKSFGIDPLGLKALVNGKCFSGGESKYAVTVVAFHSSGVNDVLDEPVTAKSGLHDIVDGDAFMSLAADQKFIDEVNAGAHGTIYMLLLVPKTLAMSQFTSMRQAKALGIQIVDSRTGPP